MSECLRTHGSQNYAFLVLAVNQHMKLQGEPIGIMEFVLQDQMIFAC